MPRKDNNYVYGFAERLDETIAKRGLSQYEVCKRVGVSDSVIWCYINYHKMPTCMTLARLSKVLGVSTDYLLGLE